MTDNTPGTNTMQPNGDPKPVHGMVVYSSDGKVLTDDQGSGGKEKPVADADADGRG